MKRLVAVLLLANLLSFAWNRGWFDRAGDPAVRQEHADRLRPVPLSRLEMPAKASPAKATAAADAPAAPGAPSSVSGAPSSVSGALSPASAPAGASSASAPAAPGAAPPASAAPNAPAPNAPAPASPSPGALSSVPSADAAGAPAGAAAQRAGATPVACRAFPPIDEERAAALRSALERSGALVDALRTEQGASYLVYLPPASSAAETQQRLVELRRIGRDDAFVIQDGPMRGAISLGLFRFEGAARSMVEQLARAGETRALVAPRPPIQVRVALQARWPQAEGAAIAVMLGAQFDAPARDCD